MKNAPGTPEFAKQSSTKFLRKKMRYGCPRHPAFPRKFAHAREARQLTWYALARLAGIPNQATIRDIEQGKDVKLSNLQAVATALGLALELAEQRS